MCVSVALMKAAQVLTQDQQKEGCLWPQLVLCTSVVSFWTTLTYSKPLMYYFYISCCVAFCCRAQPGHSLLLCSVFISCSGDFSGTFPLITRKVKMMTTARKLIDKMIHISLKPVTLTVVLLTIRARAAIGPSDAQFFHYCKLSFAC